MGLQCETTGPIHKNKATFDNMIDDSNRNYKWLGEIFHNNSIKLINMLSRNILGQPTNPRYKHTPTPISYFYATHKNPIHTPASSPTSYFYAVLSTIISKSSKAIPTSNYYATLTNTAVTYNYLEELPHCENITPDIGTSATVANEDIISLTF